MKYSELISFHPIEDIIQLNSADDKVVATNYVKTYVLNDKMAEALKANVIDQLQMEEVVDNHGVLVVGNYGTGKSHLMAVISAVANDASNLQYLHNEKFAKDMEIIAGKFEVLRMEIGGVTMPLREIILDRIKKDFAQRGLQYNIPDLSQVPDNKELIKEFMSIFAQKYPDKGYLIVVDEFLAYLSSREERPLILDLEFLRALGEMCSKSKLRVIFGVQEKIFDNPKFAFVSDPLQHVSDRFTQMIITKEATSYVVSKRILQKNDVQKAWIRKHLEKYSALYNGMAARMEEFVELFPIHPAYIDIFTKIYVVENRQILKNISKTIKGIFNQDVPDAPGIISFDAYWPVIKDNGLLRTNPEIAPVVDVSKKLEDILTHQFPRKERLPMALQIVNALSIHRLTTGGLNLPIGMDARSLKDALCLFMPIPEIDEDFLAGIVSNVLATIKKTVSGQFISLNEANEQYYIDVNKTIDYDEKIKTKASLIDNDTRNRYFYKIVYACMNWDATQYVLNFEIYSYELNWLSHNMYREGYLFMGLPQERSTAQPERDFYIHFLPPYGVQNYTLQYLPDEVYFQFKDNDDFREKLNLYIAAAEEAKVSAKGQERTAYEQKAIEYRKFLLKYLNENIKTCFNVLYKHSIKKAIEVLKTNNRPNMTFKDVVDVASSMCFDEYFTSKYAEYPVFTSVITSKNIVEMTKAAYEFIGGRNTKQGKEMLQAFSLLDADGKIKPEGSKYAMYFLNKLRALPPQGVVNYSDLFEKRATFKTFEEYFDKKFQLNYMLTPIIFLALVNNGNAEITLKNAKKVTISNLEEMVKNLATDLYEFSYLSKPSAMPLAELKYLFEKLDLNSALLNNPANHEKALEVLNKRAKELSSEAVKLKSRLYNNFTLWGESLIPNVTRLQKLEGYCTTVADEFTNYPAKYNKVAKLNNFAHTTAEIDDLVASIKEMRYIDEFSTLKSECGAKVGYVASIEGSMLPAELNVKIDAAKAQFRQLRDDLYIGNSGRQAAITVNNQLQGIIEEYIDIYLKAHNNRRLDVEEAKRKQELQGSIIIANLKKLSSISLLAPGRLADLQKELGNLHECYELKKTELDASPICAHCHYRLEEGSLSIHGNMDAIEDGLEKLLRDWNNSLLNTVTDPTVQAQMPYLDDAQKKAIAEYINSGELPDKVDEFFVGCIEALLKGFEPVEIKADDIITQLESLPPMDEDKFAAELRKIIASYTAGKDKNKLRIVLKR